MKNKKVYIYTDGGARGNPGPAGIGVVILDEKKKRIKELKGIWRSTLAPIRGAGILECQVDPGGVR